MDESGFMLQPLVRRTWAPRGRTPVLKCWDRRERLSVISAITVSPRRQRLGMYFLMQRENVRREDVARFLAKLHRRTGRAMVVVLDRLVAHRAAAMKLRKRTQDVYDFEWLPSYAPELNPVEFLWSHTKYGDLANFVADDVDHLAQRVESSLSRTTQKLLTSAFEHAKLRL
jgi:transposase